MWSSWYVNYNHGEWSRPTTIEMALNKYGIWTYGDNQLQLICKGDTAASAPTGSGINAHFEFLYMVSKLKQVQVGKKINEQGTTVQFYYPSVRVYKANAS